jgi:drug/metabolite transporter (DMT)-like permease
MRESRPSPTGLAALAPEGALALVVLLWASTYVVSKGAFAEVRPLAFVFVRFGLMVALAFGVMAFRGRHARQGSWLWTPRRRDLPRFVWAGLLGYTGYQLGFVLGLERTSPFSSSLLIAAAPAFTLVALAFLGERPPARAWLGLVVAVAGVAIFVAEKSGDGGSLVGDALSVLAAVSFSLYGIVNRPLVRDYPTETYTAYTLLAGTVPLLLVGLPDALAQDWNAISAWGWVAIIYMVILPVYVAYMLFNWAVARRGLASVAGWQLLVPVLGGILSALTFGETFNLPKLAGAALVLAGLFIQRARRTA